MGIDVADLADRDDMAALVREALEKRGARRYDGEILAMTGAREIMSAGADKGPGDDAANIQRVSKFARRLADFIKPLEAEVFFVCGNLHDGISAGIDDRLSRPHMLFAMVLDHL